MDQRTLLVNQAATWEPNCNTSSHLDGTDVVDNVAWGNKRDEMDFSYL
jgi:hypothetical protein